MKRSVATEVVEIKEVQIVPDDDKFPKGEITSYFPYQRSGSIKDTTGRNIFFSLNEMDIIGPKGKESIKAGIIVGYDLVHAGKDIHVKKMKIY